MKTANALAALIVAISAALPAAGMAQEAPPVRTYHGISYVAGGVGLGERGAMRQIAKDYNLRLSFAEKGSGTYLADVKVAIRDGKGRLVLDAVSDGPWFFAKLPPGKYRVTAAENGKTQSRIADVRAGRHTVLHFYWPQ